ncbi:hypothetical protein [Cerasicoccus arenae]|uniref:Uncharacterized protein n=1 Tax=Cerasicoccus arenae TaxID=424488 RepID=A0A8J3DAG0_9BACT|nr:hypothetical protein [Cerasicoccus arenae]MBK1858232.1 hypothetical protein [Cerasicoccus arenae]GHC02050.1 hypothetical protein GCM10007047_18190 [Cerasicoccus arenae]
MPPKIKIAQPESKRLSLQGSKPAQFAVNAETGTLNNILLMEVGEARGHGIYIDSVTLETALQAAKDQYDGQLRAYWTHDHRGAGAGWMAQWLEESGSELSIPGFFSGLQVKGEQFIAGSFEFYDFFREAQPEIVAQVLEMAAKTPRLIAQSVEIWGYAVYVDTAGNEYMERPEDTDLEYEGMPALRVTQIFASAFVADGAATGGLFANFRAALSSQSKPDFKSMLREAVIECLPEFQKHLSSQTTQTNPTMKKLIEALMAKYANDQARLGRALTIAHSTPEAEQSSLTAEVVDAKLQAEDDAAELKRLKAEEENFKKAVTERDQLKQQLTSRQNDGHSSELNLGAGSEGGPATPGIQYTGITLNFAKKQAAEGRQLAITQIADLWTPTVWLPGMPEMILKQSNLLNTAVVVRNEVLNNIATGGGVAGNIPNFREPDHADEIQVEDTAPSINKITSGLQVAPILNRVSAVQATSLAGAVSNSDPMGFAMAITAGLRLRQRETTLLNMLRGLFTNTAAGDAAFTALVMASFVETTGSQTSAHFIDTDLMFDALGKAGEGKQRFSLGGIVWMHSVIETALSKQDQITTVRDSQGNIILREWKGMQVFINDNLSRAGTTSGTVYETYFFTPGSLATGDRPQVSYAGEPESVASLVREVSESKNNSIIYDRTRFLLHPSGAKWVGTPAGQSATNVELATKANWALSYSNAKNVGIVQLLTNG